MCSLSLSVKECVASSLFHRQKWCVRIRFSVVTCDEICIESIRAVLTPFTSRLHIHRCSYNVWQCTSHFTPLLHTLNSKYFNSFRFIYVEMVVLFFPCSFFDEALQCRRYYLMSIFNSYIQHYVPYCSIKLLGISISHAHCAHGLFGRAAQASAVCTIPKQMMRQNNMFSRV